MKFIEAKQKYKSLYIYKFSEKEVVMFRPLLFSEFKAYRSLLLSREDMAAETYDEIFELIKIESSYIVPTGLLPAGVVESVVDFALSISGPMDQLQIYNDIAQVRDYNMLLPELRFLYTLSSIFAIKPNDFDQMTWEDIVNTLAQGELLMQGKVPAAPFHPAPPEEPEDTKIDFDQENRTLGHN